MKIRMRMQMRSSLIGCSLLLGVVSCSNNYNPYSQYAYPISYMQSASYSGAPQTLSSAQLESLVSPIALYPDSLLSLMLLASTYPLEIAEAYNWRASNAAIQGVDLQNALKAQSWNDSVKSLISFPQAFNMMGSKLQWTQNLGNAYKLQPADTLKAVQSLRKRAVQAGSLKTSPQMTVTTDAAGNILIAPSNAQTVYVPTYNPTIVYGAWPYPDYPPYPAYNPAWGAMGFGLGLAVGDAFWATPAWSDGTINANNVNNPSRGLIGPSNVQNQQRLLNDWRSNATPQDRQDARNAAQRADNTFQRDATPQERAQADRLNQESRNAYQQDRVNPNAYREAAQENAFREQARFNANQDRFAGGRAGGGFGGGGFGGGHMGGFRR